jgi:3-hydroxyacyl-[acyl-carrier-protein] dehydratase
MNPLRTQIAGMLNIQRREGGFTAELVVDENLPIFPDHFPDQPILPGICLVQAVLHAAAVYQNVREMRISTLKNLKFMHPVRPGQTVNLDAQIAELPEGKFSVKARLSVEDRRCAEVSLIASAADSAEESR